MNDLQRRSVDRVVTQSDLDLLRVELKDEIARLELKNEVEAFRKSMNALGHNTVGGHRRRHGHSSISSLTPPQGF